MPGERPDDHVQDDFSYPPSPAHPVPARAYVWIGDVDEESGHSGHASVLFLN
jgi:hypothetical protein